MGVGNSSMDCSFKFSDIIINYESKDIFKDIGSYDVNKADILKKY